MVSCYSLSDLAKATGTLAAQVAYHCDECPEDISTPELFQATQYLLNVKSILGRASRIRETKEGAA